MIKYSAAIKCDKCNSEEVVEFDPFNDRISKSFYKVETFNRRNGFIEIIDLCQDCFSSVFAKGKTNDNKTA